VAERVVVGGSIAALVAADALAGLGEEVRLLLPKRGVGGGFAAIHRNGRVLELGVRLLELGYEDVGAAVPPLLDYQPAIGAHRPYSPLIEGWLRELLGDRVAEAERPRMFFDDRLVDDLYFTTDPLALRQALSTTERAVIAAEAHDALAAAGCDAGLLDPARDDELARLSTGEASRRNHGPTFHARMIAPIADKIVPGGAEHVLATHRRKIWVPLFWPTTLAQACEEGDVAFAPSRPFHTVTPSGCSGLVDAIQARLQERGVRVEVAGRLEGLAGLSDGTMELRFADAGSIRAEQPVLGSGPAELFEAAGAEYAPAQARSVICWIEARPQDLRWAPSLLNIVDPEIPALRVSSGGRGNPGTHLLTVEMRHDLSQGEIAPAALQSLERTGLLTPGAEVHVVMSADAPSFPLPTVESLGRFVSGQRALAALEVDAEVVGGAAGFGVDALGEQIIQGLRAAEMLTS
jgi:hypothetical protein